MYMATLRRRRSADPPDRKRSVVFRMFATEEERHGLLYEEARVVLLAYKEYTREWMTVLGGQGNDQVRMASFVLLAQGFDDVRFAYGGVKLLIPGPRGGLYDPDSASRDSLSRNSSWSWMGSAK